MNLYVQMQVKFSIIRRLKVVVLTCGFFPASLCVFPSFPPLSFVGVVCFLRSLFSKKLLVSRWKVGEAVPTGHRATTVSSWVLSAVLEG